MNENQAVYWHQGMLMQPQHFQIADARLQFQLKPVLETALPHFWGVGELVLAKHALDNRTIEVHLAQLVFADRCYLEYPGNAIIAPRAFDTAWVEGDKPFTVFLGLRKLSQQEKNVTLVESLSIAGAVTTRYAALSNPPATPDLYCVSSSAQVLTLLHVVKIFFESEIGNLGDYDLIPIAQLVRDGAAIKLSEHFIPPCYALSGSETLLYGIQAMRDELAGRARQLQIHKSPSEMLRSGVNGSDLVLMLALRSLNRICTCLYHFTEAPQVHPWHVYGALRQLIGELSAFSEHFDMLGEASDGSTALPAYDHANLGPCFAHAYALIHRLLDEISIGPEFLTMLSYQNGQYTGELPSTVFDHQNRFYLAVRSAQDPIQLLKAMLHDARLAAGGAMSGLITHALPGLELIPLAVAPQSLPQRSGTYYFRIEQTNPLWDLVKRQNCIALHWLDAPEDMHVEIIALRK